jgi:hypothetical protein
VGRSPPTARAWCEPTVHRNLTDICACGPTANSSGRPISNGKAPRRDIAPPFPEKRVQAIEQQTVKIDPRSVSVSMAGLGSAYPGRHCRPFHWLAGQDRFLARKRSPTTPLVPWVRCDFSARNGDNSELYSSIVRHCLDKSAEVITPDALVVGELRKKEAARCI